MRENNIEFQTIKAKTNKQTNSVEYKMRLLANFLIDRFLEDKKNNTLKLVNDTITIKSRLPNQ